MHTISMVQKIILVAVLFVGIVSMQYLYDREEASRAYTPLAIFHPAVLHVADLGLDTAMGSLIWLNSIQEIGTVAGSYAGLVNDIKTINALDPRFAYPYAFAELVLPGLDPSSVADAIAIGKSGVEHASDWRIPFYLAFSHYQYRDDLTDAIKYFHIAADTPGIPTGIRGTALNFGTQTDRRAQTRDIWVSIYQSSNDEILRAQAQDNITHIDILTILDKAVRMYKNINGVYPTQTDDLRRAGILSEIPQDPLGFTYTIDKDGKLVPHLAR